jgi:hypothetical protein
MGNFNGIDRIKFHRFPPLPSITWKGYPTEIQMIIQSFRPDWFFSAEEQQRLSELMNLWRTAREQGQSLSKEQQTELEQLVEAELTSSPDKSGDS